MIRSPVMDGPKCLLFDLGSTVLQGSFDAIRANTVLLKDAVNPRHVTPEELQAAADRLDGEIRALKESTLLESTTIAFQRLLFDLLELEPRFTPSEAEAVFWDAAFEWRPTEGIESLLRCAKAANIALSIISNVTFSGAVIRHELEKQGLSGLFNHVICSSDYGFRKPSKKLFEVALLKEKCPADRAWYIGDSLDADVHGARSAGLHAIWYNPGMKPGPVDETIDQISCWKELEDRL
jgi:putative hydrolase of the HAD superfamily